MPNGILIVSLKLDEPSFEHFDKLRKENFPVGRNLVPAHLTLFHQLPDRSETFDLLRKVGNEINRFTMQTEGALTLGNGVAIKIFSEDLIRLHHRLKEQFAPLLIPQDRQKFRPHITIQNKAPRDEMVSLYNKVARSIDRQIVAEGLIVWEYLGGPWKHRELILFR